ncbi:hypothetical protein GE09DRAFT_1067588 [Coniochaeta sp. 2T2.1]|nr:hypothetical protein GE09DRAFT_1067588 [Coniochaeta sp. 2T2.1]
MPKRRITRQAIIPAEQTPSTRSSGPKARFPTIAIEPIGVCFSPEQVAKMQQSVLNSFLRRWHRMLGLPRQMPPTWYRDVAKYTSRWSFYRPTALLYKAPRPLTVREVINPAKDSKLDEVAGRHGIDPVRFRRVGGGLRSVWPLLP